jgi:hypothetical protein
MKRVLDLDQRIDLSQWAGTTSRSVADEIEIALASGKVFLTPPQYLDSVRCTTRRPMHIHSPGSLGKEFVKVTLKSSCFYIGLDIL